MSDTEEGMAAGRSRRSTDDDACMAKRNSEIASCEVPEASDKPHGD